MEVYLENISKNSNPKDNYYIVVNDTKSKIKNNFLPPLTGRGYEIALVGLSTYYSYPNVDESNNSIILVGDGHRHEIKLPKGCYELKEINNIIQKLMDWTSKNTQVTITENNITLRASLLIKDKNWYVEFPAENSLGTILGFESKEYHYQEDQFGNPTPYVSEKIVNILSVNSILVHCDIISGSMVDGVISPVIFNYSPNTSPGNKIVADPVKPIYLPVSKDVINELNIWMTDQENRLLDLQGEKIVLTFHMRER